ncbi:MAG: hypothetical protein ABIP46_05530 [Polaromonas sp.]
MTCTMEHPMGHKDTQRGEREGRAGGAVQQAVACDLDSQLLRILRCTAKAMAGSPGGLRFKPGTRPWLDELPGSRSGSAVLQVAIQ